jgi:hypothetical protein
VTPQELTEITEALRSAIATAQPLPPKLLFDARECAEITGLPVSFFETGWAAGHLPSRKIGDKYRRASLEDLEFVIEMSEVEPTSGPLLERWRAKQRQQAKRAKTTTAA